MRIGKESIYETKVKCKNVVQITLDDDFNVSDSKPDIEAIVKEWGNVRTDSVKVSGERAEVRGSLDFALIYTGIDARVDRCIPVKMSGIMNFCENVNLSADGDKTTITCIPKLEDITVKAINSRKISVKAIIELTVICEDVCECSIGNEVLESQEEYQLQVKERKINYAGLAVNLKDNFRIKENISIPQGKPNIGEIIWGETQIRNFNNRLTDEGALINGEIGVFVMYYPENEENIQYYECVVPFEGNIDVNGCNADMVSIIKYSLISSQLEPKANYDGENRDIAVEVVLDIIVKAYEEKENTIICDMYSPVKEVNLICEHLDLKKLIMRNCTKCRADSKVKINQYSNISQIINCTGRGQIDDVTVEENCIAADGAIMVNIFYMTNDEHMPYGSIRTAIPFNCRLQINTCPDMEYDLSVSSVSVKCSMSGSDELEIHGNVSVEAICFEPVRADTVNDCSVEDYAEDDYLKFPGIVGYISSGEDTLWDIAKKYHTTIKCIMNCNGNISDRCDYDYRVKKGEKLLLMKASR